MTEKKPRLYTIDLIRFLAASMVVLYHFCFRGYNKDEFISLSYKLLEPVVKYGYLGVDIFFIISGFVIYMSIQKSDIRDFIISRISRLYPAYWFCMLLTALVIYFFGESIFSVNIYQVLVNLSMIQEGIGVPHVDGVYWSLFIELQFYLLTGIFLMINKNRNMTFMMVLLISCSFIYYFFPNIFKLNVVFKLLKFLTFPEWNGYFVSGMCFYLIYSKKQKLYHYLFLVLSTINTILFSIERSIIKSESFENEFSPVIIIAILTFSYLLFYMISTDRLIFLNSSRFLSLGVLTYPLYLIHQNIGYIMINFLDDYLNKWLLLILIIMFFLIVAFIIHKFIEDPLGKKIRNKLKTHFLINTYKRLNLK